MSPTGPGAPSATATPASQGSSSRMTMGLLEYLTANALDEDYQVVARRADHEPPHARVAAGGRPAARRPPRHWGAAAVVALFALLIAVAASQTSHDAASNAVERADLVQEVGAHQRALDAQLRHLTALRSEITGLTARTVDQQRGSSALFRRLRSMSAAAGTVPVTGPGVLVVAGDNPHPVNGQQRVLDTDLQLLVNGLWQSGAQAIAINGQRLTALSAIRHAGTAITVNYRSLSSPYRVQAIGNPNTLGARFTNTIAGQAWLDLQNQEGLRFSMRTAQSLRLPAAHQDEFGLGFATAAPGRQGSGTAKGGTP